MHSNVEYDEDAKMYVAIGGMSWNAGASKRQALLGWLSRYGKTDPVKVRVFAADTLDVRVDGMGSVYAIGRDGREAELELIEELELFEPIDDGDSDARKHGHARKVITKALDLATGEWRAVADDDVEYFDLKLDELAYVIDEARRVFDL